MNKRIFSSLSMAAATAALVLSVFSSMPVKAEAAGNGAVTINSVSISGENVIVNVSASDLPDSDDGAFYLFAEKPYQGAPSGAPIASLPISGSAVFSVPLGYQTTSCRLYDKFQVAVKQGGAFVSVAGAMAGKLVASSVDEETQKKLLDDTLKEMGDDTWLS